MDHDNIIHHKPLISNWTHILLEWRGGGGRTGRGEDKTLMQELTNSWDWRKGIEQVIEAN